MVEKWLSDILEHKAAGPVLAALAGVLIRLLTVRGMTVPRAIASLVAGVSSAFWVAPLIVEYFNATPALLAPAGWVCGIVGGDVARGILILGQRFAKNPRIPWK